MKWSLFENKIKKDLSGHRAEVDIDVLWSAIEPEVDAINDGHKKKRGGILFFWFAGGLLLLSGIAFWFLKNDGGEKTVIVQNEIIAEKDLNKTELDMENILGAKENCLNIKTGENNSLHRINKNGKNNLIEKLSDENQMTNNFSFNKGQKEKYPNNQSVNKNDFIKNNASFSSSNGENNKPVIENNTGIEISKNNNGSNNITKKTGQQNIEIPNAKSIEKIPHPLIPKIYSSPDYRKKINLIFNKITLAENNKKTIEQINSRRPSQRKKVSYSVALNGGISYANRSLSGNDTLIELRNSTEKQLETSHLGVRVKAMHKSGFSITTGLQYTRMVELYERNETIVQGDSINGVVYKYVNPNNDTTEIMGQVPHKTTTIFRKKYFNKYTLFDVPILVGYSIKNGDWKWGAQAGVFANISLKTEGRFLKNETQDEDIEPLFKSGVGFSYYFSGSINCQITKNIEIGMNPYLRYFPKNFAKASYGISQQYILYGVDAKFIYNF